MSYIDIRPWIAGTALLLSSGCSTYSDVAGFVDWPVPYTASIPQPSKGRSVAISVVDERSYVFSGAKEETFIGFIRTGAGIPYVGWRCAAAAHLRRQGGGRPPAPFVATTNAVAG